MGTADTAKGQEYSTRHSHALPPVNTKMPSLRCSGLWLEKQTCMYTMLDTTTEAAA